MDGELPEEYKCSFCGEIPESEIYQCENRHSICANCITGLALCPKCNVSLGSINLRNFVLENQLDKVEFDCTFKYMGCSTKVTRREITTHLDQCRYGDDWEPLCWHLGYNCMYGMKFKLIDDYLQHLLQKHSIVSKNAGKLELIIPNIPKIDQKVKCTWKPVLLKVRSNHYLLVVQSNNGYISFTCIQIGGNSGLQVYAKFRATSETTEVPDLEWTTRPIHHNDYVSALECPPFLVSLKSSLLYRNETVLKIEVDVSDNTSSNTVSEKVAVALELHENMTFFSQLWNNFVQSYASTIVHW